MSQHHTAVDTREMKRLRADFRQRCAAEDAPCWMDGMPIAYDAEGTGDSFQLDHYFPVSTHPQLANDPANFRPSHALCNTRRGNGAPSASLGTLSRQWA